VSSSSLLMLDHNLEEIKEEDSRYADVECL
jgi:hypothetical protein